jgi:hypothetical protein
MPQKHSDQFYEIDPAEPPAKGTELVAKEYDLIDQNDDGYISTKAGDTFNGLTVTRVWVNDTVTVNVPGTGTLKITGVTFYLQGSPPVFTPTDGTVLKDATFVTSSYVTKSTKVELSDLWPECFVSGTLISTIRGLRPVETLVAGDLIVTLDHGNQPLLQKIHGSFGAEGKFAPVRICKGALGNQQELWVSQQHRMLLTGWRAELYFGEAEVLVAAKHLVNSDTISVQTGGQVEYHHLVFADHEIIFGAGIPSESCHPSRVADHSDRGALAELQRFFPNEVQDPVSPSVRQVVPAYAARLLFPQKGTPNTHSGV